MATARTIVASTNHGKEYRFAGLVFGPRAQRYDLTAEQADELERRLKDHAPLDIEPIPTKVAAVERKAKQQIRELEQQVEDLQNELAAERAAKADLKAACERRVQELEALLEEATRTEKPSANG
jgi:chromosome segregation ATPase